jgi:sugar phosphate isomerase/epimerase
MINRRQFLTQSAAVLGSGALALSSSCSPAGKTEQAGRLDRLGVNLFSIPKLLEKDFAGAMQMLSKIGYRQIEFFGPYTFSPLEEIQGWSAVTPSLGFSGSGFFGLDINTVKTILADNGLSTPSMHAGLLTLKSAMPQLAEAANTLGASYVTLPSAQTQADLDGYKKQADEFNAIGESAKQNGVRFAYHNHGNGLREVEGTVPFDLIVKNTGADLVFFQMDIYWMTAGGVDILQYLEQYKGRFRLMHIKDMAKAVRFSGDGGDPAQWIELFPHLENAGSGVIDLKAIIPKAYQTGVEHFIVERDIAPEPENDLRKSYTFLTSLDLKASG